MSAEELEAALAAAAEMDGAALESTYPSSQESLSFDVTKAEGLDLIQGSTLALTDQELARLAEHGLVISADQIYPSFIYGYRTIYSEDLPVYVSADSVLEAVHRTFDEVLKLAEERVLLSEVVTLLESMRGGIASVISDPQVARDADLYLGVAQSLALMPENPYDLYIPDPVLPVTDLEPSKIADLVTLARSAAGSSIVDLFGTSRKVDFSQFKPRGHYDESIALSAYFRAMMWLGRIDLRMLETQEDGSQTFHRRDFDASVIMRFLMDDEQYARWAMIDRTIGAFIGERDSMSPEEMDGMLAKLKVKSEAELLALSDAEIQEELLKGGWGEQRIASRILMSSGPSTEPLPRDQSFLLFGQRYTVDSHTFVNTTDDRVPGRLLPNPLDAAFAAMGNDYALQLLKPDLQNDKYAAGLAKTRVLIDAHGDDYWQGSIYTRWLGSLSLLSPQEGQTLPGVVQTDGWQRRILNTQLGSWSQLRHDTILYTKQSYTTGTQCEFPDAYVDPYPKFYAALARLAEHLVEVTGQFPDATVSISGEGETVRERAAGWSELFVGVMNHLEEMAENQRSGTPHSQELLDFINAGVNWDTHVGCGPTWYDGFTGWYPKLFLFAEDSIEEDPIVADVHTQPYDKAGNEVGNIFHVGTGLPRLMVVTSETCMGPRAYAGLAYSYGELVKPDYERLTDNEWALEIADKFPDVDWMRPLLGD
jgi:hypothetical protein